MKASILAVGTELTSGQITNRNAAWISKKLSQIGLQTELHMTVADDRQAIREALQLLERKSDFIFVTGGLGPTSDDFTRDLISEWCGEKMEFDEKSWNKINQRLSARNIPVAEFQKQQCLFPKGSNVLDNSQGTANAFYLSKQKIHLWALPGPPNEIAAVWNDHIEKQLANFTQNLNPYLTLSWDILGIGEAVAPTLVEPAVQGVNADIGYRVHLPYLEIKFSYYKSEETKVQPAIEKLEKALSAYTISRNGEDILDQLNHKLKNISELFIFDEVTGGRLLNRMQNIRKQSWTYSTQRNMNPDDKCTSIYCKIKNDFEIELEILKKEQKPFKKIISSPENIRTDSLSDRRKLYYTELVLISLSQYLSSISMV